MGDMQWWPRGDGNSDILFRNMAGEQGIAFDPECCCTEPAWGCCGNGGIMPAHTTAVYSGRIIENANPYCAGQDPGICELIANTTIPLMPYDPVLTQCNGCSECYYSAPMYVPSSFRCPNISSGRVYLWAVTILRVVPPAPPGYYFINFGFIASGTQDICTGVNGVEFSYVWKAGDNILNGCDSLTLDLKPQFPTWRPGDWCCLTNDGAGCLNEFDAEVSLFTSTATITLPPCV